MEETIDFEAKKEGFEPIPQGEYVCRLFDVDKKVTKNGDPMYVLTLKIAEGEHKGRQVFQNLPVMATTKWKIREALEALGIEVPNGPFTFDFEDLLGKTCTAVIDHRLWEGKTKENVVELRPLSQEQIANSASSDVPF